MAAPNLTAVPSGPGSLPDYEVSHTERLDSQYWYPWNTKRWQASDCRRYAYQDPEVGFYIRELFDLCREESPVGTLPCDDDALAFLLRMPVTKWRELRARAVSPLYGWYEVRCDNGQVRLAHEVVTGTVLEALSSRKRNAARNADDRMRKRLGTIAGHLSKHVPGGERIAQSEDRLADLSDWIERAYPGGSATLRRVQEAVVELARSGW